MNEMEKNVVLLSFIDFMRAKGSWCGETHVQKGTYFFQELMGVPLGFHFILYKHGPFSFDLRNQITACVPICFSPLLRGAPMVPASFSAKIAAPSWSGFRRRGLVLVHRQNSSQPASHQNKSRNWSDLQRHCLLHETTFRSAPWKNGLPESPN